MSETSEAEMAIARWIGGEEDLDEVGALSEGAGLGNAVYSRPLRSSRGLRVTTDAGETTVSPERVTT